jgi:hypothetical protein
MNPIWSTGIIIIYAVLHPPVAAYIIIILIVLLSSDDDYYWSMNMKDHRVVVSEAYLAGYHAGITGEPRTNPFTGAAYPDLNYYDYEQGYDHGKSYRDAGVHGMENFGERLNKLNK